MDNFPPYKTKFIADLQFTPEYQEDRAGADFRESEYSVPSAERKQERGVKSRYLYVPWNASGASLVKPTPYDSAYIYNGIKAPQAFGVLARRVKGRKATVVCRPI